MRQFKDNLVAVIKGRGETISSISKATGIPVSTLSEWCNGRKPTLDEGIILLTKHLGVSLEQLVSGDSPNTDDLQDFIKKATEDFVEIHSGVYRIRIEKLTNPQNKNEKK